MKRPLPYKYIEVPNSTRFEIIDADGFFIGEAPNEDTARHICRASNKFSDFKERVYELAFGDDAINRDYCEDEVYEKLKSFADDSFSMSIPEGWFVSWMGPDITSGQYLCQMNYYGDSYADDQITFVSRLSLKSCSDALKNCISVINKNEE